MATTYIAKYSDNTTQTRIQAGCFGFLAVRRSAVNPDTRKMTELVFKPFYEYHLAALLYRDQVKVLQTTTIYWWKFLLKQPYIKDVLVEVPKLTAKTKIDKVTFKVRTEIPADRALAVLYLLRAPQYATGTVLAFTYMTRRLSIKPATAFVLALGINFQAATPPSRTSTGTSYNQSGMHGIALADQGQRLVAQLAQS